MQHYTTIEQSKKLIELGLKPDTADMYYQYVLPHSDKLHHVPNLGEPTNALSWYNKGYTLGGKNKQMTLEEFCIPCWSLGALINLLPSMIYKGGETITLRIHKDVIDHYFICYKSYYHLDTIWFSKENLLDAAFEMVCLLLENGYIKKGE